MELGERFGPICLLGEGGGIGFVRRFLAFLRSDSHVAVRRPWRGRTVEEEGMAVVVVREAAGEVRSAFERWYPFLL